MDNKAMYKLSYGLFVLTSAADGKDNGCITNTAIQVSSNFTERVNARPCLPIRSDKAALLYWGSHLMG